MVVDSLFSDILTFALLKSARGIYYYNNQALYCKNRTNKSFLLYLAEKKRHQLAFLEKIAEKSTNENFSAYEFHNNFNYLNIYITPLFNHSLRDIYTIAYDYVKKELEFFQFLKILPKNDMHHSLLDTLIDLSKDFLFDVKMGYLKMAPNTNIHNHSETIEYVLKK